MPEIGETRSGDANVSYKPRECYGAGGRRKLTFNSKGEAKRAMKKIIGYKDGVPAQRGMKAYRCGTCGRYHLGHKT